MGDLVLKKLAGMLTSIMRESDTLARVGSDEFAILVNNLHQSQDIAARLAEGIADKAIEAFGRPLEVVGQRFKIEVSIGISMIEGRSTRCDQQLQRAEQATQQAKERARLRGEKRIAFFDPVLQEQVVRHVLMEDELRNALGDDLFVLYYQPQIRNPDRVEGYEVLLRWRHPVHKHSFFAG